MIQSLLTHARFLSGNQNGLEVKVSRAYTSHNLPKNRRPNSESALSRSAMVGASTRKVVSCFIKSSI